jgi:hypothetical protein
VICPPISSPIPFTAIFFILRALIYVTFEIKNKKINALATTTKPDRYVRTCL